ncbi:choline ABC transporter substrate-binding protein [Marinobacterium aestuariivivens]|uniref:Choline ABC transporter substrate-binding protein n=1 Tax=Marinobacterium aestuariivivens TaxID=1698799 RepID=A0ABW2A303_9GAMM
MNNKIKRYLGGTFLAASMLVAATAQAGDPQQCQLVRFTDPGWTDISVTNALASTLLDGLGYRTSVDLLAVPIGFESLKKNEIDVFLGNWMPAQQAFIDKYGSDVDKVRANLEGAKFTLAVPRYAYDAGVRSFADLGRHADQFSRRIYGIDPGAPANGLIQKMIDTGEFGLDGWRLVESGEQAMLSQVRRAVRKQDYIVYLGWAPHPMNLHVDMAYLSGGDDYFGPDYGGATIYTLTRKGYRQDCPNVAALLDNLQFTVEMESEVMSGILDDGKDAPDAARDWLVANPEVLGTWLEGVSTLDGQSGLEAVQRHLGVTGG